MSELREPVDVMKAGGVILGAENEDGSIRVDHNTFKTVGGEISIDDTRIALITSFAIAMGMQATETTVRPSKDTAMPELQRLATIGQRLVHNKWDNAIPYKTTGGLLLTGRELDNDVTRQETLKVIHTLFEHGEVPVINENDGITHEEISFGSNDILAAKVAACIQKSELFGEARLFLMTDVNGVYKNRKDPNTRIPVIENTDDFRHLAVGPDSKRSIGGMKSKFKAVDIAHEAGVDVWIYNPNDGLRERAVDGEIGTYFPAKS